MSKSLICNKEAEARNAHPAGGRARALLVRLRPCAPCLASLAHCGGRRLSLLAVQTEFPGLALKAVKENLIRDSGTTTNEIREARAPRSPLMCTKACGAFYQPRADRLANYLPNSINTTLLLPTPAYITSLPATQ